MSGTISPRYKPSATEDSRGDNYLLDSHGRDGTVEILSTVVSYVPGFAVLHSWSSAAIIASHSSFLFLFSMTTSWSVTKATCFCRVTEVKSKTFSLVVRMFSYKQTRVPDWFTARSFPWLGGYCTWTANELKAQSHWHDGAQRFKYRLFSLRSVIKFSLSYRSVRADSEPT